jgi:23S rRNA pseudouridine955/2504/2580 synthase
MKNYELIVVSKDDEDSRLDRLVHKKHPYLTQGIIQKALRNKDIKVNLQKASSNYRVNEGDSIQISPKLIKEDFDSKKERKEIAKELVQQLKNAIIYVDDDMLVLNKPAGLAVQGGSKIKISIDDIVPKLLDCLETWHESKPEHKLVHRLDKETSGVLLIALNNKTAKEFAEGFKNHLAEKTYLAILKGNIKTNAGQINKDIDEAKAITNYAAVAKKPNASFVEFRPVTGRTHQLRIHSLELGFPILGDIKYDPSLKDSKKENLHLHAAEISIPFHGKMLKFSAEMPDYFKKSLKDIFNL